jgi:hypothetical protein
MTDRGRTWKKYWRACWASFWTIELSGFSPQRRTNNARQPGLAKHARMRCKQPDTVWYYCNIETDNEIKKEERKGSHCHKELIGERSSLTSWTLATGFPMTMFLYFLRLASRVATVTVWVVISLHWSTTKTIRNIANILDYKWDIGCASWPYTGKDTTLTHPCLVIEYLFTSSSQRE